MSWASRRKTLYIGTVALLTAAALGVVLYVLFSSPATCTDGLRNGAESGVDCGGACAQICREASEAPIVQWARFFKVADGVYTAAAYIENRNGSAYARNVSYVFKLFGADNVLIAERRGVTSIAPTRFSPIIETNIATGNILPARIFFEFTDEPMWQRGEAPALSLTDQTFDAQERKLSVSVKNVSSRSLDGVLLSAILYDAAGTAQAASKSIIRRIGKNEEQRVVFTWPERIEATIVEAQVLPQPLP